MKETLVKLAPILGLMILGAVLFVFRWMSDPFWWFSLACVVIAGLLTWDRFGPTMRAAAERGITIRGRTFRPGMGLVDLLAFLALLGLTIATLPELAQGHRLVDHDHPVHYFKAWQLKEQFLADGRLFGWSHNWYAGYPAQTLYPIGADLMVIGIWALGLGFMSLSKAYAYAFLLFWFLQGWSLYMVGRATVGRWAGLFAALFVLSDTASFRFGGWTYAGEWGVWPNSLSVALGMMAVAYLPAILQRRDTWRPIALFGLWMGAGLISHPMQIMHLAILVPVASLVLLTSQKVASRLVGLGRLGLATGIGGAIGALWVLPFLGAKGASENYGVVWRSAYDMGSRLYHANLLEGTWVVPSVLAVLGVLMLTLDRRFSHAILGGMALILLGTASTSFLGAFNLNDITDSFSFIQYQRFSILLKPYAFLAAGFAIVAVFQALRDVKWGGANGALSVRVLVLVVLGAPILFGSIDTFRLKGLNRNVTLERSRPYRVERPKVAKWLNDEWAKKDPTEFWRVALDLGGHEHGFTDLGTVLKMPIYKVGYTPAETFTYKMESRNSTVLKAVNVRYVLTNKRLPGAQFKQMDTFGGLHIYEFKEWTGEPFVVTEGVAEVSLKSWEDERIVLKVDVKEPGKLQLNVSDFARWHARAGGKELKIEALPIPTEEERSGMMVVPMTESGDYVFTYESTMRERMAFLLFFTGLILALLLLWQPRWLGRVEPLLVKIGNLEDKHHRVLVVALGAAIGLAVIISLALAVWIPRSSEGKLKYDFPSKLHTAKVSLDSGAKRKTCPYALGHHICGEEDFKHVQSTFVDIDGKWRRCIWAHPLNGRTTFVRFDSVKAGSKLQGWYGVGSTGKGGSQKVGFKVAVDDLITLEEKTAGDDQVFEFEIPIENNFSGKVEFQISAPDQGKRHFCFFAEMVD